MTRVKTSQENRVALVTGASRGIGKAIASKLVAQGIETILTGRDPKCLRNIADEIGCDDNAVHCMELDLARRSSVTQFSDRVLDQVSQLDILVNSAAYYSRGAIEDTSAAEIDKLYETNIHGVCRLTTSLLPLLRKSQGDIVFVNSSVVFSSGAGVSHYAITKHGLAAFANALRAEINKDGIRVLSIYPGRTATLMQKKIFEAEGMPYRPELLLQPTDIADLVSACINLPDTAEVVDLHVRPRQKS